MSGAGVFSPGKDINVQKAYRDSFGEGVPSGTVITDPLGVYGEEGHDLRPQIRKSLNDEYAALDNLMADGATFRDAMAHLGSIQKGLNTTDYQLPVYPQEDLTVLTARNTPFWDMLPKVSSNTKTVEQDSVTDLAEAEIGGERDVPADKDDTYVPQSLAMTYYRITGSVSGPMQLASQTLRNAQAVEQRNKARSMAHFSANLVLNGDPTAGDTSGGLTDERGYKGVRTLAEDAGETTAAADGTNDTDNTISVEDVRENFRKATDEGGNAATTIHITDSKTIAGLKNAMNDVNQVEIRGGPSGTISVGAQSVMVDGTPVFQSDFMPNTDGGREFLTVDMQYHSVHDLSSLVMEPLAKTEDADSFFMKRYSVMMQAAGAAKYTHLLTGLA